MQYIIYRLREENENTLQAVSTQKKIIIFLTKEEDTAEKHSFLGKIMGAIQKDLSNDCEIIILNQHDSVSVSNLIGSQDSYSLILFGVDKSSIGINLSVPPYRCFRMVQSKMLFCDKLGSIERDTNLKKKLWQELKYMFQELP
jgi:hypothetical protein